MDTTLFVFVYCVKYIGLKNHNSNRVRSTKNGKPWVLIHTEKYETYTEARKRELFLKSRCGRKWVNEQFVHYKK